MTDFFFQLTSYSLIFFKNFWFFFIFFGVFYFFFFLILNEFLFIFNFFNKRVVKYSKYYSTLEYYSVLNKMVFVFLFIFS